MCVCCYLRDTKELTLIYNYQNLSQYILGPFCFRGAGWTIRNILHVGHRGEGHSGPWVMIRTQNFGFQVEFHLGVPYPLKPRYDHACSLNQYVAFVTWCNMVFGWRGLP